MDLTAADVLPILLVDDQQENLSTLEAVLQPLGYPLATANSGISALRLLLERDFGLILLDVRMPELDGLQTAELVKSRPRTRDVPIVFLTAARDDVSDIVRGYGVGAVDYVLKPFDPEVLRSKVAVFAELEASRRALKRSEAFLRGAFEAAPIGKTVLDSERRIVRSNRAFAALVGRVPGELRALPVTELCHPEDRESLAATVDRLSEGIRDRPPPELVSVDLRLRTTSGSDVWVGMVASLIEAAEFAEPLLLAQWVDLTLRRRAEQARADLLLEQAARSDAEAIAERLGKLQTLSGALESRSLNELLRELALRLAELLGIDAVEVQAGTGAGETIAFRAGGGEAHRVRADDPADSFAELHEVALEIQGSSVGALRLATPRGRAFSVAERSLLRDAAERAALAIRRAQLHEEEHRIAVELQRGLLPKTLPDVPEIALAAHYEAAGLGAEVGGDWYDAFVLPEGRLGVVVGDVAGHGLRAASAMGQLRTLTRAFAVGDERGRTPTPGEALTRLNRHQLALGDEQMFTVLYAIVDPRERDISWANAGHPPPLVVMGDGASAFLEQGEGLMGLEQAVYRTHQRPLGRDPALVLYTDGLVERRGESLDTGLQRLAAAVRSGPTDPEPLCDHILRRLVDPDEQLHDDVTALVVKLRDP